MNQHMHPVMRQALAPILPPGFRSAPAVATVDALHVRIAQLKQQVDAQAATIKTLLMQNECQERVIKRPWAANAATEAAMAELAKLKEQYTPPPSKRGEHDGDYKHKSLGWLVVHYEIDDGFASVRAAFTGKVDLIEHLSSSELEDIAEAMDKLHAEQFEP